LAASQSTTGRDGELPRQSDVWRTQFKKLRIELATETSGLGRFLSSLEARLDHEEHAPDPADLCETIGAC
jgi:hypothetical protein